LSTDLLVGLCDDGRQGDGSPVGLGRSPTVWHIRV